MVGAERRRVAESRRDRTDFFLTSAARWKRSDHRLRPVRADAHAPEIGFFQVIVYENS